MPPSPVARETRRIGGSLPIAVTKAFVKFFLNGMDRGMGDETVRGDCWPLQPAVERNVAASRSNLDFYSTLLACQAPRVSLHVHVSEALQLESVFFRCSPYSLWWQRVVLCTSLCCVRARRSTSSCRMNEYLKDCIKLISCVYFVP